MNWKYFALVLFSNLAVSVLGGFEAEEPLDRGRFYFIKNALRSDLNTALKFIFSVFLDSKITGWGETIEWKTFDNGLKEAKKR